MRLIAAALVVALAGGCEADKASQRRRDPGALVVAHAADVQALDPVRVTDNESVEVGQLIFEGLVRWKPGTTDIQEGLAERWDISPDRKQWTFHLRAKVKFHDGTPLDAEAVAFSFERLIDPKHEAFLGEAGSYWRSLLKGITRVVAIDPRTVAIYVAHPYAPLLGDLAMFPIVSPTAVRKWGDAFQRHPVGTGPFAFQSWSIGEQVVVHRFDHYWGVRPAMSMIVFRVVADERQRLVELESGSVDIATSILPDEQSFIELHPDLALHHTSANDVSYLAFNVQHEPFDDLRVRRAVSYAINKDPIVKLAYQGRAVAADGPLPPTQWGYQQPKTRYGFDPILSRKLLGEAIAAGRFDPDRIYKLYSSSTPRPYLAQPERVARFIQAALEQVGIQTELVLQPHAKHRASLAAGEHDLALFGWLGDTGDPDNFLYVLFHSDNAIVGSARNIAFYRDPGVDKLLSEAQGASDEATRSALYRAVQERIAEDAPWVPIAHSEVVVASRAELANVMLSPLGHPMYSLIRRRKDVR